MTVKRDNQELRSGQHSPSDSLERLLQSKSSRLKARIDVVASEVRQRFGIRDRNLLAIEEDKLQITNQLLYFHPNYGAGVARESQLQASLYRGYQDLRREERQQVVDCWRDVAHVMRDFLDLWDNYQESKSRNAFLKFR